MNEIRCPHCGKVFQVDESGYAQLLKQVRDAEFERDMAERERLLDAAHKSAVQAAETRVRAEGERALAERDGKIAQLQAQLERKDDAVSLARATAEREPRRSARQVSAQQSRRKSFRGVWPSVRQRSQRWSSSLLPRMPLPRLNKPLR